MTITIHMLPNISRHKGRQAMKFGQLREYNMRNVFFKNHAENEAGRLLPDLFFFFFFFFFFFQESFIRGKSKWSEA